MAHNFRSRLLQGDLLIGTMVTLNAPEVAELLAAVGCDWLFLDAEHSVFDARALQAMLQGAGELLAEPDRRETLLPFLMPHV